MSMDSVDREILEELAPRVRRAVPEARLWAFGSRARGTADWGSDFDICVVVPERTRAVRDAVHELAWEVGFHHERVIATVILSEDDFEDGSMSASTLVANIHREGVVA